MSSRCLLSTSIALLATSRNTGIPLTSGLKNLKGMNAIVRDILFFEKKKTCSLFSNHKERTIYTSVH